MVKDPNNDILPLERAVFVAKEKCFHWKRKIAARNIIYFQKVGYIVFLGLIIN
jgi:hypothetical protein